MNAFVTGGTGFIGSHLIDRLLSRKTLNVYALVRDRNSPKWLSGKDVQLLEGDLLSLPDLPSKIDYVFHIAGATRARKWSDYYTVNQEGTASLFHALKERNIKPRKFIYLSSIAAGGPGSAENPFKESDPSHPVSRYGHSKHLGEIEALCHKNLFLLGIIRVGAVFGARDKDFVPYFKLIQKGILPSLVSNSKDISLCYVDDLIQAMISAMETDYPSGEIFNIAYPEPSSWNDLGRLAGKIMKKKLLTVKVPLCAVYPAALITDAVTEITNKPGIIGRDKYQEMRQSGWVVDVEKAARILNFHPAVSMSEAVAETIDWYRREGWL